MNIPIQLIDFMYEAKDLPSDEVIFAHLKQFREKYNRLPASKDGSNGAPDGFAWRTLQERIKAERNLTLSALYKKYDPTYTNPVERKEFPSDDVLFQHLQSFQAAHNRLPNSKDKYNGAPDGFSWGTLKRRIKKEKGLTFFEFYKQHAPHYKPKNNSKRIKPLPSNDVIYAHLKAFKTNKNRLPYIKDGTNGAPKGFKWGTLKYRLKKERGLTPAELYKQYDPTYENPQKNKPLPEDIELFGYFKEFKEKHNRLPNAKDRKHMAPEGFSWGILERRIKSEKGLTFTEFFNQNNPDYKKQKQKPKRSITAKQVFRECVSDIIQYGTLRQEEYLSRFFKTERVIGLRQFFQITSPQKPSPKSLEDFLKAACLMNRSGELIERDVLLMIKKGVSFSKT